MCSDKLLYILLLTCLAVTQKVLCINFVNCSSTKVFIFRDVTKLVKIRIRGMRILTFKIGRMRMRIVAFILLVGMCCTALGQNK